MQQHIPRSTLICYFQSEPFSSKMRKRICWMRSSTGSFISATNFGTATKVSTHYTHLLLSEWNILFKMRREFGGCVHLLVVSSLLQSIGTLEIKLHTLRKRFLKGYDWIKKYSGNCNKRFHILHSFDTFRVNYSPQNEKEN